MLRNLNKLALLGILTLSGGVRAQNASSGPMRAIEAAPGTAPLAAAPRQPAGNQLVPVAPPPGLTAPSATLGGPTMDPYASGSAAGNFSPSLTNPTPPSTLFGGGLGTSLFGGPSNSAVGYPAPSYPPSTLSPYDGSPLAPPPSSYPPTVYPNQVPSTLFPQGPVAGNYFRGSGAGGWYGVPGVATAMRFYQGPRLQYTYLSGGDGSDELGIDEIDSSVAFAFPNFLYSLQPLYIVPTFGLRLLDGPVSPPADLPGQLYEASLGAGWQTDPNRILGLELGGKVGVFSDFDTYNSDSLRYMGQAIGKLRLTPALTAKAGVMYVDRVNTKLIPAGGFLWQPSPNVRYDIYFPNPKISRYCSTVGTTDLWMYLAGEWGGGSWTITRAAGNEDEIDLNDIRVMLGIEFGRNDQLQVGRRTGFAEVGYVFAREIEYRVGPPTRVDLEDALMFRIGFGY